MFSKALLLMAITVGLSLLAFAYPFLNLPLLGLVGIFAFWVSLKRLDFGFFILFGELFVGSKGHLLEHEFGPFSLSLRLVLFLAVLLAGLCWVYVNRALFLARLRQVPSIYWFLLLMVGFGFGHGLWAGHELADVFFDANGYFYLLILPFAFLAFSDQAQKTLIFDILRAAIVVIAVKGFLLFLWFTFGLEGVSTLYHWVINREIGEITGTVGAASRIFMQSQFFALVGLFIFGFAYPTGKKDWLVIAAAVFSVILSLSRSFWLGAVAASLFGAGVWLFQKRSGWPQLFRLASVIALFAVLELAALYGLAKLAGSQVSESVSSRLINPAQEAAGGARLLLLPELLAGIKTGAVFGRGFGELVTYKSYLPDRITPDNPDGEITSFAFEWGYLDTWLKLGLLGLLLYLLFVARIFQRGWQLLENPNASPYASGLLAGLVALLVLNVTTPYLNHPLGIGYLILSALQFYEAAG